MKLSIAKRTLRGKTSPARGLVDQLGKVSRTGGQRGAGLVSGASIITRGEALGHGMFIDREFVKQTADAINLAGDRGVKSRFTHPGLSSDGLGKFLGRTRAAKTIDGGDRAIGNLHISSTARSTPDGDLAGYVLDLAEDDPAAFGTSIVFLHDREAEKAFVEQHGGRVVDLGDGFFEFDLSQFKSPDERNTGNLFHARLKAIHAVDVVDEPAANPAGMFSSGADPIFDDAEALLCYALGLVDAPPALARLDVEPRKVSVFVSKFLDRHNLTISKKGEAMAHETNSSTNTTAASSSAAPPANTTPPETAASSQPQPATLDELTAGLPGADADFLLGQLKARATLGAAQAAFIGEQNKRIEQLGAKAKHLAESEAAAAQFSADGGTAGGPQRPAPNAKLAELISIGPRAKK